MAGAGRDEEHARLPGPRHHRNGERRRPFRHLRGNGSIYWTSATGAHTVFGAIRTTWTQLGAERSSVGYATTVEYAVTGGKRNDFARGTITWLSASNTTQVVQR